MRSKLNSVIAVYSQHTDAELAVRALQAAGLDMKKLSIVAKDFQSEEHAVGFYSAGDRMKFWGGRGAFWGSLWGMLFGSSFFLIPAIGPLVVMGPMVGWVVGALEGAAVGGSVGVLGAALASAGIPDDSVVKYEREVKAGRFLVLAQGSADELELARGVLSKVNANEVAAYAS